MSDGPLVTLMAARAELMYLIWNRWAGRPLRFPWLMILGLAALIVIGVAVAVLRIEKLRDRVVPILSQSLGALSVVLKQAVTGFGYKRGDRGA